MTGGRKPGRPGVCEATANALSQSAENGRAARDEHIPAQLSRVRQRPDQGRSDADCGSNEPISRGRGIRREKVGSPCAVDFGESDPGPQRACRVPRCEAGSDSRAKLEAEQILNPASKRPSEPEAQACRRHLPPPLDGYDGLPANSGKLGETLLGKASLNSMTPNGVVQSWLAHRNAFD